jgi:predicted nucleic acid-binding protein
MKNYLLDASSFMLLIKKADAQTAVRCLQESAVLDLTYYEVGNAIWKESTLTKMLSSRESEALVKVAQTVLAKMERIISAVESFCEILDLAKKERLSFYDSSYILLAKEKGLKLLTEDKELYAKAKKHVQVLTIAELLQT